MANGDKHSQKRNYKKNFKGSKAERIAIEAKKKYHAKKKRKGR